jgi:hypothetical protein
MHAFADYVLGVWGRSPHEKFGTHCYQTRQIMVKFAWLVVETKSFVSQIVVGLMQTRAIQILAPYLNQK